jgi:hypothetical protein
MACANLCVAKHLIRGVIKAVAGIAVVVFIIARFTTNTGVALFVGSVVLLVVCFGLLKLLEGDDENTGPATEAAVVWVLSVMALVSSTRGSDASRRCRLTANPCRVQNSRKLEKQKLG